jgi:hypothetical protein
MTALVQKVEWITVRRVISTRSSVEVVVSGRKFEVE